MFAPLERTQPGGTGHNQESNVCVGLRTLRQRLGARRENLFARVNGHEGCTGRRRRISGKASANLDGEITGICRCPKKTPHRNGAAKSRLFRGATIRSASKIVSLEASAKAQFDVSRLRFTTDRTKTRGVAQTSIPIEHLVVV